MAAPKVFSGARAKCAIVDPNQKTARVIGIFSSFSYSVQLDVSPAYILGRFTPAALEYTSTEPVSCTASGWRVVDHGPHADGSIPTVNQLLTHEYLQISVFDRQTKKNIAVIRFIRPTGYNMSIASRSLSEMTLSFMGILCDDETANNSEPADSTELP